MKTFTDEDMKKYTKEALFFELRNAYVKGYVDGGNKLATGCKHEKTHLERVRGWQQFYPYIPAKLYCNDCGKEITEE